MANALKTLHLSLSESPELGGVRVYFGDEYLDVAEPDPRFLVVVPSDGAYGVAEAGYAKGANVHTEMRWPLRELVELWLWGYSEASDATYADHVDVTEGMRGLVLAAFHRQRNDGLTFEPISERWQPIADTIGEQFNRYGRILVMTVRVDITIQTSLPVEKTITQVTLNPITIEA